MDSELLRRGWAVLLLTLTCLAMTCLVGNGQPLSVPGFYQKDRLTLVVTDSGLGGLSVVADAAEKMMAYRGFKQVDLIFVNALFSNQGGYNSLTGRDEKVAVFNAVLESIETKLRPDMILIGCNTLSVLYPDTLFARKSPTPVQGIVDNGVDLVAGHLNGSSDAMCILFGTQTTVSEGIHKKKLISKGIRPDRISYQACPELALFIEQGFDSPETGLLIQAYVEEAVAGLQRAAGPVFASFNCTHYGYSTPLWQQAFDEAGVKVAEFLNPNIIMADTLLLPKFQHRYPSVDLTVKVVSMVEIPRDRIESIGRYLASVSPETARALEGYELKQDLFSWIHLVKTRKE